MEQFSAIIPSSSQVSASATARGVRCGMRFTARYFACPRGRSMVGVRSCCDYSARVLEDMSIYIQESECGHLGTWFAKIT